MTTDRSSLLADLVRLRSRCDEAAERLLHEHGPAIEAYREEVSAAVGDALRRLRGSVDELTGGNRLCLEVADQTRDYVEWLQWTFWDLPYFALPARPEPDRFRHAVASCGLVYLSARLLDDLIDRHFFYRGRRSTLLAELGESQGEGRRSERLSMLAALLLCFEGLHRLAAGLEEDPAQPVDSETAAQMLRQVLAASSGAVIGAILEHSPAESWDEEYYQRLVELKNVSYWRCLYAAIDPGFTSPLYPFLVDYYGVAQKLNDIQDHAEDEARGQPNLVSILRSRSSAPPAGDEGDETSAEPTSAALERVLAEDFLRLGRKAQDLPEPERHIARLKLGEYLQEAHRLGLFSAPGSEEAAEAEQPEPLELVWDSALDEFVEKVGPDALEDVDCPVCGGAERSLLLRKRGFALQRCAACSHVFVSPRLREVHTTRLAEELDGSRDPFLDIQRIFGGYLCQLLREWATGPRLLDIGFGLGALLRTARAYGFEVHGIEASRALTERLRPFLGGRLEHSRAGDVDLPWGSFDVVVMSHVVEHLPDPRPALAKVRRAVNEDGILYVAVPDLDSLHFRVFGKRWEAITPVSHCQYFNESSLTRLLESSGFEVLTRVEHPAFRRQRVPSWMRLFRQLGGNESGELALLARAKEE